MWVTLLLILKEFLSRFAFRYQNGFLEFAETGLTFYNQSELVGCCINGYDIMGYIHKLNRIEMRLTILILKKNS